MPFSGAVAPILKEGRFDGSIVSTDASNETGKAQQATEFGLLQPGIDFS